MSTPFKRLRLEFGLALVSLVVILTIGPVAGASNDPPATDETADRAAPAQASLHNPAFDNHDWYFFHERYDSTYPPAPDGMKPILPDDDNNLGNNIPAATIQDWRLWYMRNYSLIQTFAESSVVREVESVVARTYERGSSVKHWGGLYQPIYGVVPCLVYQFQMYATSKPDTSIGSPAATLQVGIDQVGWNPDSKTDPAVPGTFPASTVWGSAADFKYPTWGQLSVTAEARSSELTVFTYAETTGGRNHAIIWDSGSFQEVTPAVIQDPNTLPAPGGVFNVSAVPSRNAATVTWTTTGSAVSQVYYRSRTQGTALPGYPNKVYLPAVLGGAGVAGEWSVSPLVKTATSSHNVTLSGLQSNTTYEYLAVSRGLVGDQCTTWVSGVQTFKTTP